VTGGARNQWIDGEEEEVLRGVSSSVSALERKKKTRRRERGERVVGEMSWSIGDKAREGVGEVGASVVREDHALTLLV
jgi:hypothetical protein